MISKDEVKHIAKLARLELTDQEAEKMQKDLSSILDYFEILKKAPKALASKLSSSQELENKNVVRRDEVGEKDPSLAGKLIDAAPNRKDGYIKVKSIL